MGEKLIHSLRSSESDRWVVLHWEYESGDPGEVIVVKSDVGSAGSFAEPFVEHPEQRAICFDTGTECQDQDVMGDVKYNHTVFAQAPDGSWHRQGEEHVHTKPTLPDYERIRLHEDGTLLAKLDTLRVGVFSGGGYSMGGT